MSSRRKKSSKKASSKAASKKKKSSKKTSTRKKRKSPKIDEYYLQTAVSKRLLKEGAGDVITGVRIGADAIELGKMAIEEYAYDLASEGKKLLEYAKKKTLSDKEILKAAEMCTKKTVRPKNLDSKIPAATLKRILKRGAGVERVSAKAVETSQGLIGGFVYKLGKNAALIAEGARRKTIKTDDLKYALKTMGREMY